MLTTACAGKQAEAGIHCTHGKGRMAMGLVAGAAMAGAAAFDEGQGSIAPDAGL
ncbi:hypothetical protein D3C76_1753460 [compost metagenome]